MSVVYQKALWSTTWWRTNRALLLADRIGSCDLNRDVARHSLSFVCKHVCCVANGSINIFNRCVKYYRFLISSYLKMCVYQLLLSPITRPSTSYVHTDACSAGLNGVPGPSKKNRPTTPATPKPSHFRRRQMFKNATPSPSILIANDCSPHLFVLSFPGSFATRCTKSICRLRWRFNNGSNWRRFGLRHLLKEQ